METDISIAVTNAYKKRIFHVASRKEALGRSAVAQVQCPCCEKTLIIHVLASDYDLVASDDTDELRCGK